VPRINPNSVTGSAGFSGAPASVPGPASPSSTRPSVSAALTALPSRKRPIDSSTPPQRPRPPALRPAAQPAVPVVAQMVFLRPDGELHPLASFALLGPPSGPLLPAQAHLLERGLNQMRVTAFQASPNSTPGREEFGVTGVSEAAHRADPTAASDVKTLVRRLPNGAISVALADPAWLRRQIGVVLQEYLLFNRSILGSKLRYT